MQIECSTEELSVMLVALTDVYVAGGGAKQNHNSFYCVLGNVRAKIAGALKKCSEEERHIGLEHIKKYRVEPESKPFVSLDNAQQLLIIDEILQNEKKKYRRTRGEMSGYILHRYNVRITLDMMRDII